VDFWHTKALYISETRQGTTKVTIEDNKKSPTCFRLVPKYLDNLGSQYYVFDVGTTAGLGLITPIT